MVQVNTEITGLKELSKNSKALKEALGEDVLVSALVDTGQGH